MENGSEMCSDVTDTVNMCVGKLVSPALNGESVSLLLNFNLALNKKAVSKKVYRENHENDFVALC